MAHFGLVPAPVYSHVQLFLAVAQELQMRGHRITFFQMADCGPQVRAAGFEFVPLGHSDHPAGSLAVSLNELRKLSGTAALRFTVQAIQKTTRMICRDLPGAVRSPRLDMLLVDQTEPAAATVAESAGLPFVTLCSAVALHRESRVPPSFTSWSYATGVAGQLRNRLGYWTLDVAMRPVLRELREARERFGLPRHASPDETGSRLAQICQQPRAFDFPRRELPPSFHYTGPLRVEPRQAGSFPWHRLDGRPLIYASLGTVVNRNVQTLSMIGEACRGLDAQLVISHARSLTPEEAAPLEQYGIVVDFAPQYKLLGRARLCITHAGLNSVLESLSQAVPMVAVPVAFEQFGAAARVRWTGTGEVAPASRLSVRVLREAIERVLTVDHYRNAAKGIQRSIREAGGVTRAASIIEQALFSGRPVERDAPLRMAAAAAAGR